MNLRLTLWGVLFDSKDNSMSKQLFVTRVFVSVNGSHFLYSKSVCRCQRLSYDGSLIFKISVLSTLSLSGFITMVLLLQVPSITKNLPRFSIPS